jgi:hypothetical protein
MQPALKVTHGSVKRNTYRCGNYDANNGGGHVNPEAVSVDRFIRPRSSSRTPG